MDSSRPGTAIRGVTVAVWLSLSCFLLLGASSRAAQEGAWNPDEVQGPCEFSMPAWNKMEELEKTYRGINEDWLVELKTAVYNEYEKSRKTLEQGATIDLSNLVGRNDLPFVGSCVQGSDANGGESSGGGLDQNSGSSPPPGSKPDDPAWKASIAALTQLVTHSFRDLAGLLQWLKTGMIVLGLILVVAIVGLLAALRSKGQESGGSATHDGFRSPKDPLNKLWNDPQGPMVLMNQQIEALGQLDRRMHQIHGVLQEISGQLAKIKTPDPPTPSTPPPDQPVSTPLQVSRSNSNPGVGRVRDLLSTYAAEARSFAWEGATSRFSPRANGDFALVESQRLLIPRVAKVQRTNDWYRIPGGFELDNRQTGVLFIEAQPELERQSDGSYLLVRKGRLRTVSEE